MKTKQAIELAGSVKGLADMLGITSAAVCQWADDVPQAREWQLRVVRPEWFAQRDTGHRRRASDHAVSADAVKARD